MQMINSTKNLYWVIPILARWANKPIWVHGFGTNHKTFNRQDSYSGYRTGTTIFDKINGTSGPPLPPPISIMQYGAFLLFRAIIACFVPFYSVQDCSLQLRIMS